MHFPLMYVYATLCRPPEKSVNCMHCFNLKQTAFSNVTDNLQITFKHLIISSFPMRVRTLINRTAVYETIVSILNPIPWIVM